MITIEMIDEFRKRTNSSYEEARFFLERNNEDVLEAIIAFENMKGKGHPKKQTPQKGEVSDKIAEVLQKGFDLRLVVEDKQEKILFTIPILLMLLMLPFWFFMLIICIGLYLIDYKLSFRDVKSSSIDLKAIFKNLGEHMGSVGTEAQKQGKNAKKSEPWERSNGNDLVPASPAYSNRKNMRNNENVPNRENIRNKENTPNRENIRNNENAPNRENMRNNENMPNRENMRNNENAPNREFIRNKENTPDRENFNVVNPKPLVVQTLPDDKSHIANASGNMGMPKPGIQDAATVATNNAHTAGLTSSGSTGMTTEKPMEGSKKQEMDDGFREFTIE